MPIVLSTSITEPLAISKNLFPSVCVLLDQSSAIFRRTEMAAHRICDESKKVFLQMKRYSDEPSLRALVYI